VRILAAKAKQRLRTREKAGKLEFAANGLFFSMILISFSFNFKDLMTENTFNF
jgi:hypothetical protein